MFTGIVEEIGSIHSLVKSNKGLGLSIRAKKVIEGTGIGDSIAVNGVCITVEQVKSWGFSGFVMKETLVRTTFPNFKNGGLVNLERALTLEKPLGGHLVTGHVEGVGQLVKCRKEGASTWFYIRVPNEIAVKLVMKGSIAIDGISLTIGYLKGNITGVSVIPHTLRETILCKKKREDKFNIESDYLLNPPRVRMPKNRIEITEQWLKEMGYSV